MIITSITPLLVVLTAAIAVAVIIATGKKPNLREGVSFAAAITMFLLTLSMVDPVINEGKTLHFTVFEVLPGIELAFKVDALGLFFAITATFLWIVTTAYSIGYMRGCDEKQQTRYYACFAIALSSAMGVAFSANLFTLYLFYEILSIMTYPLVAHHEDEEGWIGSKKYLIYLVALSKSFLLAAVVMTYMITGTLDFQAGGIFNLETTPHILIVITYICFLAGFAKAGMMPFHHWLPAAMVAPTPVSGLLHAVAVVKVGVFSVVRIMLDVFGVDLLAELNLGMWTAYFVSFTIISASIIALTKDDLKARLAYSTISQLSYVILGVALLTPNGITGGILHIANHAFSKITLFFSAGSIYTATHLKKISQMGGIAKKLPITFFAFTVGAFSMIGIPGVAGFTSKWYMSLGALEEGQIGIIFILLTSTMLNAAYFLPVVFQFAFGEGKDDIDYSNFKEASPFVWGPLLLTAIISLIIGFYPDFFVHTIEVILAR